MRNIRSMSVIVMIALGSLGLIGCGSSGLSGTYIATAGQLIGKLTFTAGNKVEVDYAVTTMAGTYVVEGKTVKVTLTSGNMYTFTIDAKGCLDGSDETFGAVLCKQ